MDALKLFQEYMGTGLIVLWFLVSLLYLWLTEKRKYIRVMFLYVPLVLLLVFFNPLVAKILPDPVVVACDTGDCFRYGAALWKTRR